MEPNNNKPLKQERCEMIDLGDSDSDVVTGDTTDDSSDDDVKPEIVLPLGFLDPLTPEERALMNKKVSDPVHSSLRVTNEVSNVGETVGESNDVAVNEFKQFWNAGGYEAKGDRAAVETEPCNMDRLRVNPQFLHSNATSHKWALGAFAELLDNALDEVCNGASYVHLDVIKSKRDHSKMLLVEDNGGGMSPDMLRQCMSLGYSSKSGQDNTIGLYGNGFKTSTMRLGADVIVFSRSRGRDGGSSTQSVGMLSSTFLKRTNKDEIVVPMIDYKKGGSSWDMIVRSSRDDWRQNLDTLLVWSPFSSEAELFKEFDLIKDQGTRIVIYNLWQDDQGDLELDFDTDKYDIQIKGANRDEKKIEMANTYPNSRHFLTYSHSLRSYAAILYLRVPPGFRIILRGRDVEHHNLVNDMMYKQEHVYRPVRAFASVIIGFVKDAKAHIDVQGFCVYHKNRLIRPFWRVWNAAGSGGRGIIGVIEADFVKPAHDKQGFEHTSVLIRLESRIREIQKKYWGDNCHQIGYVKGPFSGKQRGRPASDSGNNQASDSGEENCHQIGHAKGSIYGKRRGPDLNTPASDSGEDDNSVQPTTKKMKSVSNELKDDRQNAPEPSLKRRDHKQAAVPVTTVIHSQHPTNAGSNEIEKLKKENVELREKLKKIEGVNVASLKRELQYEKDRNNAMETKLKQAEEKIEEFDKEQETLIDIFSEERSRRDEEEDKLRRRLKEASKTIEDLEKKLKQLENRPPVVSCKIER
ncbi:hypothetical protein DCAR_0418038 [Daucus carota subsp. sativus]|uniref:Morc S5 domain-containing protein n=1 Tax=Daucus carota subsp. sativus TaxID=79200 RepID=A0AAF0WZU1_DAUCS|nr:hypothetical protein DCAR_0418038 [Daucus carota subsp. sativus]